MAFRSDGIKEIFTPSKQPIRKAPTPASSHENKSQMAFRSGLRSPPTSDALATAAVGNNLTKSMDQSLMIRGGAARHAAIAVASNEKPWVPSISNRSLSSPSRGGDSLSRSWTSSSSARKGTLASDIARSPAVKYSPARSRATSPPRATVNETVSAGRQTSQLHNNSSSDAKNDDNAAPGAPPVVSVGEARLSQLCREDKAKVAKLIAQVTKLRHEVAAGAPSASIDSLVLDSSSSSSVSAAALKVQEKLEYEVNLAQQRLEVLQDDNKMLNEQTETVRTKYARSLEMLKQYQDRLIKLSEEKEDANNASRVMQACESAASSRLLELESELRDANEKLLAQQNLVSMHAKIEEKQERRVQELETKLTSASKVVHQSSSPANASSNNPNNPWIPSSSKPNLIETTPERFVPSPTKYGKLSYSSPYAQSTSGGGNLKRARSVSPVRPVVASALPMKLQQTLAGDQNERQQELTPRSQARKRLTAVTKEVVFEIQSEIEKAQLTAEEMTVKGETPSTTASVIPSAVDIASAAAAVEESVPIPKKQRKKATRPDNLPIPVDDVATINSIAHVQKIYGAAPKAVAHVPSKTNSSSLKKSTAGAVAAPPPPPPLSQSVSPNRAQYLKTSASSRGGSRSRSRSSSGDHSTKSSKVSLSSSATEKKKRTKAHPKNRSGNLLARSSKEDLVEELRRAQNALALLRLEQAKLDLGESEDTAEPQIASPERPTGVARRRSEEEEERQVMRRRQERRQHKKKKKKKSTKTSSRYLNSMMQQQQQQQQQQQSPPPMTVSLTPKLSDSINFYDGTSLLDVIEAVEDSDLSLSSIGFEDDDLDGMSVNASMEQRVGDGDSPVLYIAAAPRWHGSKARGRRRRKRVDDSEASSASALWSSVGKYLNNQTGRETPSSSRAPRAIVERPGGREGDYWGSFPGKTPRTTPSRFTNRWREREEVETNKFQRRNQTTMEEVYEDDISLGGESSKGEPIYRR